MAMFTNLDRHDAAVGTKHPFQWQCELNLGGEFPVSELKSVKLHVGEDIVPPLRIAEFLLDFDTLSWKLKDHHGTECAKIIFPIAMPGDRLIPVRDTDGCLAGHVVCTPALVGTVTTLVRQAGGMVTTNSTDFVFDESCHIPVLDGMFRAIEVNGVVHTSDITLNTTYGVRLDNTDSGLRVSAVSPYSEVSNDSRFTELKVNNENRVTMSDGWHMWMRHKLASNLRVLTSASGELHLLGVTDVR